MGVAESARSNCALAAQPEPRGSPYEDAMSIRRTVAYSAVALALLACEPLSTKDTSSADGGPTGSGAGTGSGGASSGNNGGSSSTTGSGGSYGGKGGSTGGTGGYAGSGGTGGHPGSGGTRGVRG